MKTARDVYFSIWAQAERSKPCAGCVPGSFQDRRVAKCIAFGSPSVNESGTCLRRVQAREGYRRWDERRSGLGGAGHEPHARPGRDHGPRFSGLASDLRPFRDMMRKNFRKPSGGRRRAVPTIVQIRRQGVNTLPAAFVAVTRSRKVMCPPWWTLGTGRFFWRLAFPKWRAWAIPWPKSSSKRASPPRNSSARWTPSGNDTTASTMSKRKRFFASSALLAGAPSPRRLSGVTGVGRSGTVPVGRFGARDGRNRAGLGSQGALRLSFVSRGFTCRPNPHRARPLA